MRNLLAAHRGVPCEDGMNFEMLTETLPEHALREVTLRPAQPDELPAARAALESLPPGTLDGKIVGGDALYADAGLVRPPRRSNSRRCEL